MTGKGPLKGTKAGLDSILNNWSKSSQRRELTRCLRRQRQVLFSSFRVSIVIS